MGRPPCCDKSNVKRGLWTADEDAKILAYVANHGIGNWTLVPQKAGLNRCGKSCRLRWTNYLRPDLRHDHFTPEEEQLILDYHKAIGSRWSLIAKQLPGRTDNDVKNHWNTKLKKKLSKMGIDPVTHKPFSQIISDYGKITRLPNTGIQTGSNAISMIRIPIPISEPTFPFPFPDPFQDKSIPHTINQETIRSHIFATEVSSSSTSSSSSCSVAQSSSRRSFSCLASQAPAAVPSSPSSWSTEFLLGEPVPSQEVYRKQDLDLQEMLSSAFLPKFSGGDEEKFSGVAREKACEEINDGVETKQCSDQAGSSSANSFVDSILDRDSEMRLEFPEFLNDYFSY